MASVNDVLQRQVTAATTPRHEEETTTTTIVDPTNAPSLSVAAAPAVVVSDLPWASSAGEALVPANDDDEAEPTPVQDDEGRLSNIEEHPLYDSDDNAYEDQILGDFEEQSEDDDDSVRACVCSGRESNNATESDEGATLETTEQQQPQPPRQLLFSENNAQYNSQELQNLATLLDRLGRTLTDAAPHIALLAANLSSEGGGSNDPEEESMEHDAVDDALEEIAESLRTDAGANASDTPIRGLLSMWSRERRNRSNGTSLLRSLTSTRQTRRGRAGLSHSTAPLVDPDHEDYVSGIVNTTRGEVRTGPRTRTSNDDVANLLGAYLAAAALGNGSSGEGDREDGTSGLGQLLRGGAGGGGGGIDIHIHAVVTGPGGTFVPGAGTGNAAALFGGTAVGGPRNIFSTNRRTTTPNNNNNSGSSVIRNRSRSGSFASIRRRVTPPDDGDAEGIFDELYSETPEPIDPNGSQETHDHSPSSPPPFNNDSIRTNSLLDAEDSDNNSSGDYITGLNASYLADDSFRTMFPRERVEADGYVARRIPPVVNTTLDSTNVGAATLAGRGILSSTRRRSRGQRETLDDPTEHHETPRHRLSGLSRLFRRRSSRSDERSA